MRVPKSYCPEFYCLQQTESRWRWLDHNRMERWLISPKGENTLRLKERLEGGTCRLSDTQRIWRICAFSNCHFCFSQSIYTYLLFWEFPLLLCPHAGSKIDTHSSPVRIPALWTKSLFPHPSLSNRFPWKVLFWPKLAQESILDPINYNQGSGSH